MHDASLVVAGNEIIWISLAQNLILASAYKPGNSNEVFLYWENKAYVTTHGQVRECRYGRISPQPCSLLDFDGRLITYRDSGVDIRDLFLHLLSFWHF